jgi:hypothetical protein
MRAVLLLPLSVVLAAIPGCGYEGSEEVAFATTERDLTLPEQASKLETVSAVELHQPRQKPELKRSPRPSRPARAARIQRAQARTVAAAPSPVPAAEASRPTPDSYVPTDRELLPGKTVTVIPASGGPTPAVEVTDKFPTPRARGGFIGIRGGGKCPPRPVRGITIGPRPRLY